MPEIDNIAPVVAPSLVRGPAAETPDLDVRPYLEAPDPGRAAVSSPIVLGLSHLLESRGVPTGRNARLARWGARVAIELGLDETDQRHVELACLLRDVGKVAVPGEILHKPGPLGAEEQRVMSLHPEYGWAVLRLFPELRGAGLLALHHHERMDGTGYPGGLRGNEIALGARIVAVVDAFDAIVSERSYRGGLGPEQAAARLITGSGTHFDPDVVRHFLPLVLEDAVEFTAFRARAEARAR